MFAATSVINEDKSSNLKKLLLIGKMLKNCNFKKSELRSTIKDYEMIGDAPVPVKWVYARRSKKVLDLDFRSSNELCSPKNFPDDVNFVMKGLAKKMKSKAKAEKLKIHRQVGSTTSLIKK